MGSPQPCLLLEVPRLEEDKVEAAGASGSRAGAGIGTGKSRLSPTGPGRSFPCSCVRSTPCTQSQWSNPSAAQMLKQTSFHLISKSQALLDPLLPRIWDGLPKHDRLHSTLNTLNTPDTRRVPGEQSLYSL